MQNQCNSNMVVDQNNTKNTLNAQCNLMNAHTNNMMSDGIIPSLSDLNHEMGLTPPQPLAGEYHKMRNLQVDFDQRVLLIRLYLIFPLDE